MRALVLAASVWLLASGAAADAIAPNQRGLAYSFAVDNLAEHADYAFILYPTSNSGYGYVLEPDLSLTGVMMGERRGRPTRLVAMTRADLRRHDPDAPRHPHADDDAEVLVVEEPPASAPVATAAIHPPGLVTLDDPRESLSRTFHIARVSRRELVLELVEEVTRMRDGTSVIRSADGTERTEPAPPGFVPPAPRRALFDLAPPEPLDEVPAEPAAPEPAAPAPAEPAPAADVAPGGCGECATRPGSRGEAWLVVALALVAMRVGSRRRA